MARSLTVYEQTPTAAPSPSPTPLIDPVFIRAFQVSPNQIQVQQYVNISWDIVGPVTQLRLQRNNDVILDGGNQQNSVQDYLDTPGDYIYTLTVVNPVGQTDTRSDHVLVEPVIPTVGPVGPAIQSFTSSADVIDVNQCVTLAWQVQGDGITNITLTQNGTPIYSGVDASNQVQDCLSNPGRALYRLSVTASGGSAEASLAVDVQIPLLPTPEEPVYPTEEPTLEPPVYPTEEPTPEAPVYPTEEPTPEPLPDSSAVLSPAAQVASWWSALFQLNIWH
jgi:hypothetical protein